MNADQTAPVERRQGAASADGAADSRATSSVGDRLEGLRTKEARKQLLRIGYNEIAEARHHPARRLLAKFTGPSAWMLETITAVSFLLGKTTDASLVAVLLVVNAILGFIQEGRASAAVEALKRHLQLEARVRRDGAWVRLPARELVPGDVIRCRSGDLVPADAAIAVGTLAVDESVLTGESGESTRHAGDTVHSGTLVRHGEATARVTATGASSRFGRTAQLVRDAQPRLHIEAFIARIVRWLAAIVGTLVACVFVLAWQQGHPWVETARLSLVLLMSAIPVALPVMLTVTMAAGALSLSRRGVLVTRLSAAEDAAVMDTLLVDKTGTLTLNRLELAGVQPLFGASEDDVLSAAAYASDEADQDPIDVAVLQAAAQRALAPATRVAFSPFDPTNRRTEAEVVLDGRHIRFMKGAVGTLASACGVDANGQRDLQTRLERAGAEGLRVLAVAHVPAGGAPALVGLLLLRDPPRPDAAEVIQRLRTLGISVRMLTGDAVAVARSVARQVGLGAIERNALGVESSSGDPLHGLDGLAEVFPEDKFAIARSLQAAGHVVGMTGDGVNDAPALRQAEVGIAVAASTDTAKAAASVVLTQPGLINIIALVEEGRMAYQRVLTWVLNKISRTLLKSGFVAVAFLATGRFVVSAFAMLLLVFMTDFMKISLATDRVAPASRPQSWDIRPYIRVAVALGTLMLAEALVALAVGWHALGLAGDPAQLYTFSFLVLLDFGAWSLLSLRERRWFGASRPSRMLSLAFVVELVLGTLAAALGVTELHPPSAFEVLALLAYSAACCLGVNDAVKLRLLRRMPLP